MQKPNKIRPLGKDLRPMYGVLTAVIEKNAMVPNLIAHNGGFNAVNPKIKGPSGSKINSRKQN